jgi:hypothetical protein
VRLDGNRSDLQYLGKFGFLEFLAMVSDDAVIKEDLSALLKTCRTSWKQRWVEREQRFVDYLDAEFPSTVRIEQIYMFENNITVRPVCDCGKLTTFRYDHGFGVACSKKCTHAYWKKTGREAEIRAKANQTVRERYGVGNAFQSEEIKEKIKGTLIAKYGVDHPMHLDTIKNKVRDTNLSRYGQPEGRINDSTVKEFLTKRGFVRLEQLGLSSITILTKTAPDSDYLAAYKTAHSDIEFRCEKCKAVSCVNYMTILNRIKAFGTPCSFCSGVLDKANSSGQRAISAYIKSLGLEIRENDRLLIGPQHLDIVMPKQKIAIEYNGLYYHSEVFHDENYHVGKMQKVHDVGYRLLSIFEDEWLEKAEIVQHRLKYILGLCDTRHVARHCKVEELSLSVAKDFVQQNHLQGYSGCRYRYGLTYENCLLAVMTFSLPSIAKGMKNNGEIIELNRYCANGIVVGGAGKLLKHFCRVHPNYQTIVSFADRRWSDGELYKTIGFTLDHVTSPGYWYVRNNKRIHRFALRKNATDDPSMTEAQNRMLQGYRRIWDCGHLKFVYNNPYY